MVPVAFTQREAEGTASSSNNASALVKSVKAFKSSTVNSAYPKGVSDTVSARYEKTSYQAKKCLR